jgi:putative IMPACT (imprinted ancient) family translation regulator
MQGKIYDVDGSYITVPQVRFFLNRELGRRQFVLAQSEFLGYLKICKAYNLVSDLLDQYPEDGYFYWDDEKGCVSFAFIEGSTIAKLLDHFGIGELDFGHGQDKKKREDF